MSEGRNTRLFEGDAHADHYATYRPVYPPEVVSTILRYLDDGEGGRDLAIDVACGNGQSTTPLATHFKKIIGIDVSLAQIEKSTSKGFPNVSFRQGLGEDLSFVADSSVNLITTALGLHWLDQTQFFKEAKRVMKPKAVIAAYGYKLFSLDKPEGNDIINEFYGGTLDKYWQEEHRIIDRSYADYSLPFADFTREHSLSIQKTLRVSEIVGFMSSWSAYHKLLRDNPTSTALQDVQNRLVSVYQLGNRDDAERGDPSLKVTWPIYLLLGRQD